MPKLHNEEADETTLDEFSIPFAYLPALLVADGLLDWIL